jgi:hypothetical protein
MIFTRAALRLELKNNPISKRCVHRGDLGQRNAAFISLMYCNPSELQIEKPLREHHAYLAFYVIICTAAWDQHSH